MDVPQVDVLMGDLHGALSIDVQVRGGHEVHVETFCKNSQTLPNRRNLTVNNNSDNFLLHSPHCD